VRLPPAMKEWRRKQPQVKSAQVAQVVKLDKASLHRQEDRDRYTLRGHKLSFCHAERNPSLRSRAGSVPTVRLLSDADLLEVKPRW
jgi:hypothetical protein